MKKAQITLIILFIFCIAAIAQKNTWRLWYDAPAKQWEECVPLGNGRLGMTPDGGITKETVVLNDITLWSGASQDANNYEAFKKLPQLRQLLLEGKNDEAQVLMNKDFVCKGTGSESEPFGAFQMLGNLVFDYSYNGINNVTYQNYTRELSLNKAIANTTFKVGSVTYKKEYLTSFDDDVCIIRMTADKANQINFQVTVNRSENAKIVVENNELVMFGQLKSGNDREGMKYYSKVKLQPKGGKLTSSGQSLQIKNATEVIVYVLAKTNWRDTAYKQNVQRTLNAVVKKSYAIEKQNHIAKFQKLFNRVSIDLGQSDLISKLTTAKRLENFKKNPASDNNLAGLMFQYGRYLSISSTRIGLLPANLQGLWANQIHTPWNSDYHLDMNVEMNHWGLGVSNLSELTLPLVDLMEGMVPHGEKSAKAYYNVKGWIAHVITNLWGFTEPGEGASWGVTKCGSGWVCNNLWSHYLYSRDKKYLEKIYPLLKGAALFYNSILIKDPKSGYMVAAPSSSPENTFYLPGGSGKWASICIGAMIDNQIIRELFDNTIIASQTLGKDKMFRDSLQQTLRQIPPVGIIAPDGRLQEWLEDYKETDVHHRHISHLYGLYPANQITPERTPAFAEAAKKTLNVRGDDGPSWSIANKQLMWARLYDGNRAFKLFKQMMRVTLATDINYGAGGGVYPNLLSAGPPFQIDGNFGVCAGIGEMLLQSHDGFINFLPAIPDEWKTYGEVKGLKAIGNYTVDFKWENGIVTAYKIISPAPKKVKIKINGHMKIVNSQS
jgi:alpha-L-fucosidase 2